MKFYLFILLKRSHIRQTVMDVIFGTKMEVPMYQNQKVKCEPMSKSSIQPALVVTVSKILH